MSEAIVYILGYTLVIFTAHALYNGLSWAWFKLVERKISATYKTEPSTSGDSSYSKEAG
jgi:hypothetical protein